MSNELAAQRIGLKEGILERKVAFVTGAGRGIGKEISARYKCRARACAFNCSN
jgi:NAD(P)-dependent dehydrogenase (short-subunit alcohol dehydrogenase family)